MALLQASRYSVMRSAGSGVNSITPDIIAVRDGDGLAFECKAWEKSNITFERGKIDVLKRWQANTRMRTFIGWRTNGQGWLFIKLEELAPTGKGYIITRKSALAIGRKFDEIVQPKPDRVGVGFGVMLLKDGKVLLGHRNGDPEKASSLLNGAGKWTMPGGKLHFGETFEAGARREVMEETGIKLKSMEVIAINNDMVDTAHFVTLGFLSKDFDGEAKVMEPNEITEWKWFPLNDPPKPLYFPSERVFGNYLKNKFYISSK